MAASADEMNETRRVQQRSGIGSSIEGGASPYKCRQIEKWHWANPHPLAHTDLRREDTVCPNLFQPYFAHLTLK